MSWLYIESGPISEEEFKLADEYLLKNGYIGLFEDVDQKEARARFHVLMSYDQQILSLKYPPENEYTLFIQKLYQMNENKDLKHALKIMRDETNKMMKEPGKILMYLNDQGTYIGHIFTWNVLQKYNYEFPGLYTLQAGSIQCALYRAFDAKKYFRNGLGDIFILKLQSIARRKDLDFVNIIFTPIGPMRTTLFNRGFTSKGWYKINSVRKEGDNINDFVEHTRLIYETIYNKTPTKEEWQKAIDLLFPKWFHQDLYWKRLCHEIIPVPLVA